MDNRLVKMLLDSWEYPVGDRTRLEILLRRCRVLMDFYGLTYDGDQFSCNAGKILPVFRDRALTDILNVRRPPVKFELEP